MTMPWSSSCIAPMICTGSPDAPIPSTTTVCGPAGRLSGSVASIDTTPDASDCEVPITCGSECTTICTGEFGRNPDARTTTGEPAAFFPGETPMFTSNFGPLSPPPNRPPSGTATGAGGASAAAANAEAATTGSAGGDNGCEFEPVAAPCADGEGAADVADAFALAEGLTVGDAEALTDGLGEALTDGLAITRAGFVTDGVGVGVDVGVGVGVAVGSGMSYII